MVPRRIFRVIMPAITLVALTMATLTPEGKPPAVSAVSTVPMTSTDPKDDVIDNLDAYSNLSKMPSAGVKRSKPSTTATATATATAKTKPTKTALVGSNASASLRRIKKEYKDAVQMGICYDWVKGRLITSASTSTTAAERDLICVGPLASNLRHWHFSFRGVQNSLYGSGIYHGLILLPKDYPSTPPRVQLWTPSGRFVPYKDICLSASAYHPESWTPRWTVLSLIQALRLHMLTNPQEIGGMMSSREEILEHARKSLMWKQSWRAGKTSVVVDHSRLLEQGVLSVDDAHAKSEDV